MHSFLDGLVAVLAVQAFGADAQVPRRKSAFAGGVGPLGLTTEVGPLGVLGPRAVFWGTTLGEMGLLNKLGVAGMLGLSVA